MSLKIAKEVRHFIRMKSTFIAVTTVFIAMKSIFIVEEPEPHGDKDGRHGKKLRTS